MSRKVPDERYAEHGGDQAPAGASRRWVLLAGASTLVYAATGPVSGQSAMSSSSGATGCKAVYVAGHERHASIILDRRDFDRAVPLPSPEFRAKDWLEIGWGDADFYQDAGDSVALGVKALFFPTGAVVHLHGFNGTPASNFPKSEIVEIFLTPKGYDALLKFLAASFARSESGALEPLGPGLYGLSRFYAGTGTYSLFNTCNTWVAEAMAAGGLPVDPDGVVTVSQVMDRVRGKTYASCTPPSAAR